ncbi:MAG: hypothetical protein JWO35_209 [Candidatus Saccharibacteria bacterium]|nr:hypothetical protein [Candidatus Saccharibacteria bacterium]
MEHQHDLGHHFTYPRVVPVPRVHALASPDTTGQMPSVNPEAKRGIQPAQAQNLGGNALSGSVGARLQ